MNAIPSPIDQTSSHPIVGKRVELQLFTTLRCNLKCTYCSESSVVNSQGKVSYSMEALDSFIRTHLSEHEKYVTFYGGEPTLNVDFIDQVMQRYPHFRYQLQTNGTLLHRLPDAILARLSNVLVSVDGGEKITDGFRGKGVYRRVINRVEGVRGKLGGSLTARVTWGSEDTTFEELDALLDSFDYVYWQFVQSDSAYSEQAIVRKRSVLKQLVARFFASSDAVYRFIPIMGIVRNKVLPSRAIELYHGHSQCRASTHILNVLPDGSIFPCPDMTDEPSMQHGSVTDNWLKRSPLQPHPDMPCNGCSAYAFCRGNCMKNLHVAYVKRDDAYRRKVVEPVCDLVKFLGEEIDRYDPKGWFAKAPLAVRNEIANCEVYEYVEVMP
ncbi:MAG TPA: radical SAM protein [Noviherbaspirillum sp.]